MEVLGAEYILTSGMEISIGPIQIPIFTPMIATFLSHSFKKFTRSSSFQKEVATQVMLGILGLMVAVYSLALGFVLDDLIRDTLGHPDPVSFINGVLVYYFAFEFMMRYFMQSLPALAAQPYFHLPVKKSTIVHFLLGKSIVNVFNVMVVLVFAPFAFQAVARTHGAAAGWAWLTGLVLLGLCMNYIVILFKKKLDDSVWGLLVLVLVAFLFGASDYYGLFKMSDVTKPFFQAFITQPAFILVPVLALAVIYWVSYRFFLGSLYAEEITTQKDSSYRFTRELSFLRGFGIVGDWINIELRLILRNKRPRTMLYLSAFFLLYGLIFYTKEMYTNDFPAFLLFIGIFITGVFMINYGQFLYSWQGSHYDFTLTQPVSLRQYLQAKYYMLCAITIISFLLSIPYVYFGWRILFIHGATALFNIGVNVWIVMNMGMWGPKRIDLKKASAFNYEGVGAAQWLMSIPILLGPYLFYIPFNMAGYPNLGLAAVAGAGVIGIALSKIALNYTTNRLAQKKYEMAAAFRED